MRRRNRPGFTFIELLVVMVVMGLLASIGVPRIRRMKERAYQATLRSDLGALRTAEEAYFAEHEQYTTDITRLDFRPSARVLILVESDNPARGWKASAYHMWLSAPCTTAAGAEAVGIESGAVVCASLAEPGSAIAGK